MTPEGGLGRLAPGGAFMAAGPWERARVAIFGVPMDQTTSYHPGTRLGPARIREASFGIEEYSLEQDASLEDVPFADLGDVTLPHGDAAASLAAVEEVADAVWSAGRRPVAIGGEHLLTVGLVRAAARHYPALAVVQFDAHADLREDYLGVRLSHACAMRRVTEVVGPAALFQFGIRSATREEAAFGRANTRFFPSGPGELVASVRGALEDLRARPVYITLDVDVLDPSEAPGTGTPEPGGPRLPELLASLHLLAGLEIAGADLVEVAPEVDPSARTPVLAAKILREALISWFSRF